jgi:hypothetical protein
MKYTCRIYPELKLSTPGGDIRFKDGEYETSNPVIIAALENTGLPISPVLEDAVPDDGRA